MCVSCFDYRSFAFGSRVSALFVSWIGIQNLQYFIILIGCVMFHELIYEICVSIVELGLKMIIGLILGTS